MSYASWMGRTLLFRVASGTKFLGVSSNHDINKNLKPLGHILPCIPCIGVIVNVLSGGRGLFQQGLPRPVNILSRIMYLPIGKFS